MRPRPGEPGGMRGWTMSMWVTALNPAILADSVTKLTCGQGCRASWRPVTWPATSTPCMGVRDTGQSLWWRRSRAILRLSSESWQNVSASSIDQRRRESKSWTKHLGILDNIHCRDCQSTTMIQQEMKEGNLEWWTIQYLMPGEKAKSKFERSRILCRGGENLVRWGQISALADKFGRFRHF